MTVVTATLQGVDEVNAVLQRIIHGAGGQTLRDANEKGAREFMAMVRIACPRERDPDGSALIDTLKQESDGAVAVIVSIGDEAHKYPAHLEMGHRSKDGTHVPGKAFWYPAKRSVRKRNANRITRAERAAIKAAVGTATTLSDVGT